MGLVLGIILGLITLGGVVLMIGASAMSDSPSASADVNPWPLAVIGFGMSAALIVTHFHPIHLSW